MSASVMTDRANLRRRGTLLAYIFANQGWGSFVGALVFIIVMACYKGTMEAGHTSKVDGAWRIVVGVSLVPAFATLYQRLTLPEAKRFKEAQMLGHEDDDIEELKRKADADVAAADSEKKSSVTSAAEKEVPGSPRSDSGSDATLSQAQKLKQAKKEHWRGMHGTVEPDFCR